MAKYIIECPRCGKPIEASTGLFAKKEIVCPECKRKIDLAMEKMVEETCPRCGGKVIYDRTKPSSAVCPTCHTNIKSGKQEEITCPSCGKLLPVDANATTCTCPQCKSSIDVQARLSQKESGETAKVIKWDGAESVMIYRHPVENFKLGSQLIVKEGQKAVFFRNGQALDVFGPGRYTLETQNLPLIEEVLKYPTDADLTFSSQVYFVRSIGQTEVLWAVPKMPLKNPGMNFYVDFIARGSANIQVKEGNENVRKFLAMVIGDNNNDGAIEKYDAEYINNKFRNYIIGRLGSTLADIILSNNINIMDLSSKRAVLGDMLGKEYNVKLEQYGLEVLPNEFLIISIDLIKTPEVETWLRQESDKVLKVREEEMLTAEAQARQGRVLVEEQTEVQKKILRTQGEGEERKISAMADADVTRIEAQGAADATIISTKANAESTIISSQAEAEATIVTGRAEAETTRLTGQASAEAYRAQAIAEADEMHAKGYTYAQETSRQIGLEALQNGLPGTGGGGVNISSSSGKGGSGLTDTLGDMIGLGVGLSAMGGVVNMTKDIVSPIIGQISDIGKQPVEPPVATMPQTNLVSAWNCACGKSCITSKFCPECGSPKPATLDNGVWNCTCGQSGITSNFCPNCGAHKPISNTNWNCHNCGQTDITSNFCPNCGSKKGE